ncbi:flagellin [Rhodospirillaceae bacterium SYSU D60014]|uniref:flagellin N-terminal helical domain-containing protein n=1 Tax=Virgifigura deserti TaxID=2268457 RepID=UPI000E669339
MALNAISNYAANVAHRYLQMSDTQATNSLAKLSSGTRVLSARDDAASLAIGSRLNAEVAALRQASVNAGQAVSMLQIADGAMGRVQDILIRMKTLAVQAGSGQLSATERGMLDGEYQALLAEVDRIAADTEFNGIQLLNSEILLSGQDPGFQAADGVINMSVHGVLTGTAGNEGSLAFDGDPAGGTFTLTASDAVSGTTATYTASLSSEAFDDVTGLLTTGTAVKLASDNTDVGGFMTITLNTSFNALADVPADALNFVADGLTSYSYKVGSGTRLHDQITVSLDGVSTSSLGLVNTDITDAQNADAASEAISLAIDTLNTGRADIGASQNRLEFAAANISTAVENAEAARSSLMDLDIAAEMTTFTSKQILVQAGVSMLAQANQMPQNLLRLFQ